MTQSLKITPLDSISYISTEHKGQIIIFGPYGGYAAGRYALTQPPYLTVVNGARIGKDVAEIVVLRDLEASWHAAVAVAHSSARIGKRPYFSHQ